MHNRKTNDIGDIIDWWLSSGKNVMPSTASIYNSLLNTLRNQNSEIFVEYTPKEIFNYIKARLETRNKDQKILRDDLRTLDNDIKKNNKNYIFTIPFYMDEFDIPEYANNPTIQEHLQYLKNANKSTMLNDEINKHITAIQEATTFSPDKSSIDENTTTWYEPDTIKPVERREKSPTHYQSKTSTHEVSQAFLKTKLNKQIIAHTNPKNTSTSENYRHIDDPFPYDDSSIAQNRRYLMERRSLIDFIRKVPFHQDAKRLIAKIRKNGKDIDSELTENDLRELLGEDALLFLLRKVNTITSFGNDEYTKTAMQLLEAELDKRLDDLIKNNEQETANIDSNSELTFDESSIGHTDNEDHDSQALENESTSNNADTSHTARTPASAIMVGDPDVGLLEYPINRLADTIRHAEFNIDNSLIEEITDPDKEINSKFIENNDQKIFGDTLLSSNKTLLTKARTQPALKRAMSTFNAALEDCSTKLKTLIKEKKSQQKLSK